MNQAATPNTITPAQNTGSADMEIGVAVLAWPPFDFNALGVGILQRAFDAGLRRKSLVFTRKAGYFIPCCVVMIVEVRRELHSAALEAISETLGELDLLGYSKIARLDADSGFAEVFLAPALIELGNSEVSSLRAPKPNLEDFLKSLLLRYEQAQDRAHKADTSSPENPS